MLLFCFLNFEFNFNNSKITKIIANQKKDVVHKNFFLKNNIVKKGRRITASPPRNKLLCCLSFYL